MKRGVQEKGGSGPPDPPSGHAYETQLLFFSENLDLVIINIITIYYSTRSTRSDPIFNTGRSSSKDSTSFFLNICLLGNLDLFLAVH